MARIKFSAFINSASGSLNGSTVKAIKSGSSLQNKKCCIKTSTLKQSTVQLIFSELRKRFSSLSPGLLLAWNNYPAVYSTAFNYYVSVNYWLYYIGSTTLVLPPLNNLVSSSVLSSLTITNSTQFITLRVATGVPSDSYAVISCSKAISPGRAYDQANMYVLSVYSTAGQVTFSLQTLFVNRFGQFPAVGQKVYVSIFFVNKLTGAKSAIQIISQICS